MAKVEVSLDEAKTALADMTAQRNLLAEQRDASGDRLGELERQLVAAKAEVVRLAARPERLQARLQTQPG